MNQDKILLTGANGFLATILKKNLEEKGLKIYGLSRTKQDFNVDISQSFELPLSLDIDVVIHTAGKAHAVPRSAQEEDEFFKVNFDGVKNLCFALEKLVNKPRAFVFISTVAVYGLDVGENINEEYPLLGKTPYAKSKIMAENWLMDWAIKQNIKLSILRLPLVAGPNPPGNLGAMVSGIRSGRYLTIGQANAKKSIVWADDISTIIPTLVNIGGTFNLTDGCHPSFRELESAISKCLKKKSNPKKVPFWFAKGLGYIGDIVGKRFPINSDKLIKITSSLTFSDSKAVDNLGWKPTNVLDKISQIV